jgi:hypothetical protein
MNWKTSWRISVIGAVLVTSLLAVVDSSEARCRRRCRRGGCSPCYSSCNYGGSQCYTNPCYGGGCQGYGAPMQRQPMPLPPQAYRSDADWGIGGSNPTMPGRQPTPQSYDGPPAGGAPRNPEQPVRGANSVSPQPPQHPVSQ